ncbi:TlyA family RNA methyltransferase [Demequina activiva]|uniref:16S/23S rRNA (Cytidine-2'-O)-methyltransferase n=1 Tax=Demequina activiva TaxID=1582364 RepID=A0A919Q167_9MICO|nr:TlyA family RNA methyltransferase [Demequina activiva]GIG54405.1 16S/23S rRNA (cytidine-2'-O)-methyltransferase [Demequina activiva]
MRLDRALAARGLARSRSHAQELIAAGAVTVDGVVVTRAASEAPDAAELAVAPDSVHYVSRAAHKLLGALDACAPLGLDVAGAHALDAGASTGGFTQVLLERGAARVDAVDVGHGQLVGSLRADPRVTVTEGMNVRDLAPGGPGTGAQVVVADLSFISLTLVLPSLVRTADAHAEFVLMVKPQFEVGRSKLSARGVVTDPRARASAVRGVADAMSAAGIAVHDVARSALPGPQGNVEFFVWGGGAWQARPHRPERPVLVDSALDHAIAREVEGDR